MAFYIHLKTAVEKEGGADEVGVADAMVSVGLPGLGGQPHAHQ